MEIKIKLLEQPDAGWDKRVLENNGPIYQTTAFAEFQEQALGMKTLYLVAMNDLEIIGQLLVNYAPLYYKYLKDKHEKLYRFFWKHFKTHMFVRGPIIINKNFKKDIYVALLNYLEQQVKKKGFILQDLSLPVDEEESIFELFKQKGYHTDSWGTIIVDVTQSEEVLWKNIGRDKRRSIKNAEQQGLVVKEAKTTEDYDKVVDIIQNMSDRNKILKYKLQYYHIMFKILRERNLFRIFYIEKEGNGVATISIFIFGKKLFRTLAAHTDHNNEQKLHGMEFLEWFVIKWAHQNGYNSYDFTGIRPESKDKKNLGIMEYKRRWGGKEIHFPYFTKKYSFFKLFLVNSFKRIAKKIKFGIEK